MERRLFLLAPFALAGCKKETPKDAFGLRFEEFKKSVKEFKLSDYHGYLSLNEPGKVTDYVPGTLSDAGTDWDFKKQEVLHNGYVGLRHGFNSRPSKSGEVEFEESIIDKDGMRTAHDANALMPKDHLQEDKAMFKTVAEAALAFIQAEQKAGRSEPIYEEHKKIFNDFLSGKTALGSKPSDPEWPGLSLNAPV